MLNNHLRLLFCGRNVRIYDYDKSYDPLTTDDADLVAVRYNRLQLAFFTASTNKIKVWNALTGNISKMFVNPTKGAITSFEFDLI